MVSNELGVGTGTSALVAEWTTSKIEQVALTPSGASYTGSVSTFLTGIRNPLAIIKRRGGLLVRDWTTGKIYEIS